MSKTVVVKVGSSTLTDGTPHLSKPNMLEIVRQIAMLNREGYHMLLVSSGAMAAGNDHLGHPRMPSSLPIKQMLSAVGQSQLMHLYSQMFGMYDVLVGQVLVTDEDLRRNRDRYLNIRDTLETLLDYKIVPIINENDTVTVEAIKVGDNDNLAARIASVINADILIMLTDRDGLYDSDPRTNPDAKRIETVTQIDGELRARASAISSSGLGVGGMATKIQAAELAGRSGIESFVAHGKAPDIILRILHGESPGTRFLPSAPRVESRKRWLLSEPARGILQVDEGAAKALQRGNVSLLPVGIKAVQGKFERGALVVVHDLSEKPLAHGQVNYSSDELIRLCGVRSSDIESVLGYTYGDAAIHHDNMALIKG